MARPKHEVAEIIHRFRGALEKQYDLPVQVKKILTVLGNCRTAAMGGHVSACTACGTENISYNSCRNRHSLGVPALSAKRSIKNETVAKGRHYDFRFLYYEFSVEFSSFLTSFQSFKSQ
jgi:hypothetical protein